MTDMKSLAVTAYHIQMKKALTQGAQGKLITELNVACLRA